MGKIYDALKKAEREALLRRKEHSPQAMPLPTQREHAKTSLRMSIENAAINNEDMLTRAQDLSLPSHRESLEPVNVNESPALVTLEHPHSFIAEQFKILRTRLFRLNKSNTLKTILVTSTLPQEGKTTIASNLAVSIAQGFNEDVILIDTDLRRPAIADIFSLPSGLGLSDYLGNTHNLPDVLQKTRVEKLSVIPSGAIPENPSALIASEKMKKMIRDIKSLYRDHLIILDSSPVQQTSEPRILSEEVDGILLVVRAGLSNRELIRETVNTLGKAKILGIVFNYSREKGKSYYNNYYSYYPETPKGKKVK